MAYTQPVNDSIGTNRTVLVGFSTGTTDATVSETDTLANSGYITFDRLDAAKRELCHYDSKNDVAGTVHLDERGIYFDEDGVRHTGVGTAHDAGVTAVVTANAAIFYDLVNEAVSFAGLKTFTEGIDIDGNWTAAGATCANLGTVSAATITALTATKIGIGAAPHATYALNIQTAEANEGAVIKSTASGGTAGIFLIPNNNANGITIRASGSATPSLQIYNHSDAQIFNLNSSGEMVLGGSLELNFYRTDDGVSLLDFHSAAGQDFGLRIMKDSTTNGACYYFDAGTYGHEMWVNGAKKFGVYPTNIDATTGYFSRAGTPIMQKVASGETTRNADGEQAITHGLAGIPYLILIQCVDPSNDQACNGYCGGSVSIEGCIYWQAAAAFNFDAGAIINLGSGVSASITGLSTSTFTLTWSGFDGETMSFLWQAFGY